MKGDNNESNGGQGGGKKKEKIPRGLRRPSAKYASDETTKEASRGAGGLRKRRYSHPAVARSFESSAAAAAAVADAKNHATDSIGKFSAAAAEAFTGRVQNSNNGNKPGLRGRRPTESKFFSAKDEENQDQNNQEDEHHHTGDSEDQNITNNNSHIEDEDILIPGCGTGSEKHVVDTSATRDMIPMATTRAAVGATTLVSAADPSQAAGQDVPPIPPPAANPTSSLNENRHGLVVAMPVTIDRLETAEPVHSQQPKTATTSCFRHPMNMTALLISLTILVIVVVVVVSTAMAVRARQEEYNSNSNNSNHNNSNISIMGSANATWPPSPLLFPVPNYTQIALMDPSSAQSKAYKWILEDPNLCNYQTTTWRLQQRFALVTVFYSTGGHNWLKSHNWMSYEVDECQWYWAKHPSRETPCMFSETENMPYQVLWLRNNLLSGTIPPQLTLLERLQDIQVDANPSLKGTFPEVLYSESKELHTIWIHRTQLEGTIPTTIGQMTQMNAFQIFNTNMGGTLPSELGKLTKMVALGAGGSNIHGTLPTQLGLCANMRILQLRQLQLTGTFPTEMVKFPNLEILDIVGSGLSGKVPVEFWDNPLLRLVHLGSNYFSGILPGTSFGQLSHLEKIILANNSFSGSIPSEFGLLSTNLNYLRLDSNRFSGSIPRELANLSSTTLTRLDVTGNPLLTGEVPTAICSNFASSVFSFDCSSSLCGCSGCSCT